MNEESVAPEMEGGINGSASCCTTLSNVWLKINVVQFKSECDVYILMNSDWIRILQNRAMGHYKMRPKPRNFSIENKKKLRTISFRMPDSLGMIRTG